MNRFQNAEELRQYFKELKEETSQFIKIYVFIYLIYLISIYFYAKHYKYDYESGAFLTLFNSWYCIFQEIRNDLFQPFGSIGQNGGKIHL